MAKRRGRGEGSIFQRADGLWVGSVQVGYAGGRRHRKVIYGKTRKEVQGKMLQVLRGQEEQTLARAPERLTVGAFLARWLDTGASQRVRPTTLESYREIIRLHVEPHIGRVKLAKLTPEDVRAMLKALEDTGASPRRRSYARAVLRIALNHAIRDGLVIRNVAALTDAPRVEHAEVRPLSPEQVRAFLDSIRGDRLEALFVLAVATGLRRSELVGLAWEHVDLERASLRVVRGIQRVGGKLVVLPPKTERSKRTLSLPRIAVEALRAHRSRQREDRLLAGPRWQENGLVFPSTIGTPMDGTNVNHRFHTLLKRAGLPPQRFHDLRHGAASLLLAQGVSMRAVMEQLGHSQMGTTSDLYSHIMPAALQENADQMDAILSG